MDGTAVIRPEDLAIIDPAAPTPAWCVEGTIRLLSFQGSRFRLEVRSGVDRRIVCSLPPGADVSALTVGSRVRLGCVDPTRVHIIQSSPLTRVPVTA
ncbi:TOBE domain-containing protein [Microbacterium sp. A204]|uniref:TOBE domain-containing protein n=1 Tax=Microbacterium sp. A204 TaxID=3457321 RepID=UPI003FD30464